ncbi:Hint domain-containing protein [uncultured Ruegeria sp.]|uniref:Hint domain-containing protein n=1 Tax=uncultured Ruegeria sp. TaxID=259304 RepID=UPI0026354D40|nr:Hint domain-containing protein [uncultured Ruegeria sp.]
MVTTTFTVYRVGEDLSGPIATGNTFEYIKGNGIDNITITDDDNFINDVAPNTEIGNLVNLDSADPDLGITRNFVGVNHYFEVTGSDGSSFRLYAAHAFDTAFQGSTGIGRDDIGFFSDGQMTPGVTYTVGPLVRTSTDGTREHVDLVAQLCFAKGMRIALPDGTARPVEDLKPGDFLQTRDQGAQKIAWIGHDKRTSGDFDEQPYTRPVRISAGALGDGLPRQDLVVSRQHRILISSELAQQMFDARDVLIAATDLLDVPGVFLDEAIREIEYYHILMESHQALCAEGCPAESFYAGPVAVQALTEAQKAEIRQVLPAILEDGHVPAPAALIPRKGSELRFLVSKILKRGLTLTSGETECA